jgi:phage baseplate assembly protein W
MKGIIFPLTISNGKLAVASEAELYKGYILSWLQTFPRERVMRPSYGMQDYLFETHSDLSLITTSIKSGLNRYVPEIDLDVQGSINDQGQTEINIYWTYEDVEQPTLIVTL